MRFNYVKWQNFKSYGDYVTIVFLNNIETKLITGDNGSGKTSFVDAIIWCLYGRSLSAIDEVVNRDVGKNCKVEVEFEIGQNSYNIVRYRNHDDFGNKLLFYLNSADDLTKRNINETQNKIMEVLQIPYYAMVASLIFSSEVYVSFLRAKNSERLRVFDGILNLRVIGSYYDTVRKLRKPAQDKIAILVRENENKNSAMESLKINVKNYIAGVKNTLQKLVDKKNLLEEERENIEIRLGTILHIDHIKELEKNEEHKKIIEFNKKIDEEIQEEDKKIYGLDELFSSLSEKKSHLEKLEKIDIVGEIQDNEEYNHALNHNQEIENRILILQKELSDLSHIEEKIEMLSDKVEKISLEITKINQNICPTCKQKIDLDLSLKLIHEREIKFSKFTDEKKKAIAEHQNTRMKNVHLKSQIEKLLQQKLTVPEIPKYDMDFLNNLERTKTKVTESIVLLDKDIASRNNFNEEINNRISKLKSQLYTEIPEKPEHNVEFLRNIKEQVESLKNRIDEIEKEKLIIKEKAKSTYDENYLKTTNKEIGDIESFLEENSEKLKKIKGEDFHYSVLQNIFSNKEDGLKKIIISRMIALFNERINFYLPLFFNREISIHFDKNLIEDIKIGNKEVSFSTFSSGEKTRLDLAISFSLFMLVKSFFSSTINLLIFDEILDKNLDKAGVSAVLEIIENLSKNNCIFVISHRYEYKEFFNNQMQIFKDKDGFSKMIAG